MASERTPRQQRIIRSFDQLIWRLFVVVTLLLPIHLGAMIILIFVPRQP